MHKSLNLTQGGVLSTLVQFTVPILLAILLQTAYGTADLLIVGQFSTVGDVSGVTIGSQVMNAITQFCTGLSMGTTILIARYIGSAQPQKATRVAGVSVMLFSTLALIITLSLLVGNGVIANIMRTPAESLAQTKSYLFICGLGTVFIVFYNLLGSVFRGIGDSKTPLLTVFIACIINIALDLLLVGGLGCGTKGAATATVIAQASSVVLSVLIIRKRELSFSFAASDIQYHGQTIKDVVLLGLPIALQGMLVSVSFLAITAIINVFGVAQSAAVGIVEKITGLVMVVPQAFSQALSAFTAQNLGAEQPERAKKGLVYSISISLAFGVVTAYLSMFHGTIFTHWFTDNPDTTTAALQYLQSYSIDCVFVAIMFSFCGYFNGCGKTAFVMVQSVTCALCIRIPLAYFFSTLGYTSLFIIGLATPASTFIQIFLCVFYYRKTQCGFADFHWRKRMDMD